MTAEQPGPDHLFQELEDLKQRLQEAEDTLQAIRDGGIDALVVVTEEGEEQLFTLQGADRIYRVFLDSIGQGALTLNDQGMILYANAAAASLLGTDSGPLVGSDLRSFVRRDERDRYDALLRASHEAAVSAEIQIRRGPRRGLLTYLSLRTLVDRGNTVIVALLTDLSGQRKAEEMLEAGRLARAILDQAGESIVVCDEQGVIMRCSRTVTALAGRDPLYAAFHSALPLETPDGKRVRLSWTARQRPIRAREVLLRRPDGVSFRLLLSAHAVRSADHRFLGTVITLTDVTVLMEAREQTERLLSEADRANKELTAIESLSLAGLRLASVDQLTHSIVSQVATTMGADQTVLLLLDDGRLRPGACVPPSAPGTQLSSRVGSGFADTIVSMRRTLVIEDVRASRVKTSPELQPGIRSLLGSPLLDGDTVVGVLYVGWREKHTSDVHEQRFLEIIATRAAAGVKALALTERLADALEELQMQNEELVASREAVRASEEKFRGIVDALQQNFMHTLRTPSGFELAAASQSAGALELIGGDFHDVLDLPDGSVAVLVGDVEGKGVSAAGLTETVRAAVHALATVSPSARYCLNHVNRMLLNQESPQFCTALMMTIDRVTGEALVASAGHPPPVLIDEHGPRSLEVPFGPPLGTFDWDYEQLALTLAPGSTLVIYTDGLTEARREGRMFGERGVLEVVSGRDRADTDGLVSALRSAAVTWADTLRDDLQILALRFDGERPSVSGPEHILRLAVPHVLSYLGDVRGSVRDFLAAHGLDGRTIEHMVLCVEEACTNALRHSKTSEPAQLLVWFEDGSLRARVKDTGVGFDPDELDLSSPPDTLATGGRGLYLIKNVADEMDITVDDGTTVSMRIRLR